MSEAGSRSLSFDLAAKLYDATRRSDDGMLSGALDFICESFPPQHYPRLFEPGVGTGRIAIPLAERGYQVHGIDISAKMLRILRRKLRDAGGVRSLSVQRADVTSIPQPGGSFDICVAVHLFYFIPNWQAAIGEMARVLRPGGPMILMNTGTGMEVPFLNELYKSLCARAGHPYRNAGVRSTSEVVDYLRKQGYAANHIEGRWRWVRSISLETAVDCLERRAYSFTLQTPRRIHLQAIARMRERLAAKYETLGHTVSVPNEIRLVVVHREVR